MIHASGGSVLSVVNMCLVSYRSTKHRVPSVDGYYSVLYPGVFTTSSTLFLTDSRSGPQLRVGVGSIE